MSEDVALAARPTAKGNWTLGSLVDADAHIDPPYDMWKDYLPKHLVELAPRIEEGEEVDYVVFEGSRRPVRMINNQAGRAGKDFKMVGKLSEQRAAWQPETRLADMDTDGIDSAILWAACSELGLVTTIHLGARVPRFGEKQFFLADMPMSKLAMAEPIAIAIFNGIFQRFPDLRFASVESGVGWFAWFTEYLDRTWEKQRFWTESTLTSPPSFFMDRNVFGSFIQDRPGILCRDLPGAKNIMWSSDYPHSETTFPRSREVILRDFKGIPDADTRNIICHTAKKLYGLESRVAA